MKRLRYDMKVCGILLAALLLVGISFAHSGTEADMNRIPKNTCKIVGGQEATPGAWPWMTALIHSYEDSLYDAHFCGGTLIHPKWVVTAAHCVDDKRTEDIEVVAGIHDLAHDAGKRIKVRRIISHPAYDYWTDDSDIALLELEEYALQETIPLVSEGSVLTGKDAVKHWNMRRKNIWLLSLPRMTYLRSSYPRQFSSLPDNPQQALI